MKKKSCTIFLFIIIIILINTLIFAIPANYNDPTGYPSPWPDDNNWLAYTYFNEVINDKAGSADLSSGGTTPNQYVDVVSTISIPSVSYYGNGTTLFLRLLLADSPLALTGNSQPYKSATWNVLIELDGDGYKEFVLQLDGSDSGAMPDDLVVYYADNLSQSYSETNVIWRQDSAKNPTSSNNIDGEPGKSSDWNISTVPGVWDFTRTRVVEFDYNGETYYYLDMQIPVAALDSTAFGGTKIDEHSRLSFAFTTSNSNTDPTQKDFIFDGDYTMSPNDPIPFGDSADIYGNIVQSPWFKENGISLGDCGPNTLISAYVVDTNLLSVSEEVLTSVSTVTFYYYFDRNENGLADDGFGWIEIGDSVLSSNINPWEIYLNTTTLPKGQYLIKAIATDYQLNSTDSYDQFIDGDARVIGILDNSPCGTDPLSISGKVFEDKGDDGYPYIFGTDIPRQNAELRLYIELDAIDGLSSGDGYIESTFTDGSGDYSFSNLVPGIYYVVVNSKSISSTTLNTTYIKENVWPEQTFVRELISSSYIEEQKFGGENPSVSDNFNDSSTLVSENGYQHISEVHLLSNAINIDFGFSFDVIVNENDTGNNSDYFSGNQGSLRQYILNSNAIDGANESRFVMMTSYNVSSGGNLWWEITLEELLPDILDYQTTLNGTVYATDSSIVNSNSSTFGGGTTGIDNINISPFDGSEIEININDLNRGLYINGVNTTTVKNISFYNLSGDTSNKAAAIYTNNFSNYSTLENLVIGVRADGQEPTDDLKNKGHGILIDSKGDVISHVYVSFNENGILIDEISQDTLVILSEIVNNGSSSNSGEKDNGITINDSQTVTVKNSLLTDNGDADPNSMEGNGIVVIGSTVLSFENLSVDDSMGANISFETSEIATVTKSYLTGSINSSGIRVGKGSKAIFITKNSYGDNKVLSIDLLTRENPEYILNDWINPNDDLINTSSSSFGLFGNYGIDHPVITSISLSGNNLDVDGYIGSSAGSANFANVVVEFYTAVAGEGDDKYNDGLGDTRPNVNENPVNSLTDGLNAGEGYQYIGELTADSNGNFSGTLDVSGFSIDRITAISHLFYNGKLYTSEFGKNTGFGFTLSGIVFEDTSANGYPYNNSEDHLKSDVKVRIYKDNNSNSSLDSGDLFISETTTDSNGEYSFENVQNGKYYIVVNSKEIKAESLNGSFSDANLWAEQTFVREYISDSYVEYQKYGGENPTVSDNFNLSSTLVADNTYEHISEVDLNSTPVPNIDFGFSFEVVVNENDSGNDGDQIDGNQGTLRQAILNSNAETGANSPRFVMMTPQNVTSSGNLWWSLELQDSLPVVTDTETTLDGTVYATDSSIVNSNTSSFGSVVTGIEEHTISDFSGPEIEININDNDFGIRNDSSDFVLENFSLYNLGGNLGDAYSAVYLKGNYNINDVISGLRADGTVPDEADKNSRFGFMFEGTGEIEHIYAAYSGTGILVQSDNATITEAVVTNNAAVAAGTDGNGIYSKDGKINLSNSYVYDNGGLNSAFDKGNGIYANNITDGQIVNSTVDLSNAAGISLTSVSSLTIQRSIIQSSSNGPGIRVDKNSKKGTFTQNSYGDNGGLAIDLIDDTTSLNEGVTPNDDVLDTNTANNGVDNPIITSIQVNINDLIVEGYVGNNSGSSVFSGGIVEIYSASAGSGDSYSGSNYGEGINYLGYLNIDSNGEFSGTLNLSSINFETITGLTIFESDTSEFGKNKSIYENLSLSGYVYVDINFNKVKDFSEAGVSGVRIELWKYLEGVWYEVYFTNTDSSGYYSFSTASGDYRVVEDAGNVYDSELEGADPSRYISSTPNSVFVRLFNVDKRVDFGDFPGFKVEGYVFEDKGDGSTTSSNANNGIFDSDEYGISGVLVKITSGSNTYIRNTDSSGKYLFNIYNPPEFPITISEVDLTGYVSTGDYDSNGSDPIFERNRIILNSVGNINYNFADVKKLNIKGVNNITISPGSIGKLIHTLEVKTPGSVDLSAVSSKGYFITIYKIDSEGNIIEEWNDSEILEVGIYDFAVFVTVPVEESEGTIDNVKITATESWLNSTGTDEVYVNDLIYVSDQIINLTKSVRNFSILEDYKFNTEAEPGQILEYRITFSNSGLEEISSVMIIDPIDTNTSLINNTYNTNFNLYMNFNGIDFYLVAENGSDSNLDGAKFINDRIYIDIDQIVGNVSSGVEGVIYYRVKINQ